MQSCYLSVMFEHDTSSPYGTLGLNNPDIERRDRDAMEQIREQVISDIIRYCGGLTERALMDLRSQMIDPHAEQACMALATTLHDTHRLANPYVLETFISLLQQGVLPTEASHQASAEHRT